MEYENICIEESLDNHLMRSYFEKIIDMNGEQTIKAIFEELKDIRDQQGINHKSNSDVPNLL